MAQRNAVAVDIFLRPAQPDEFFSPARRISFNFASSHPGFDGKELFDLFAARLCGRLTAGGATMEEETASGAIAFACPDVIASEIIAVGFIQQALGSDCPIAVALARDNGQFSDPVEACGTMRKLSAVTVRFAKEIGGRAEREFELTIDEVAEILDGVPEWSRLLPGEADEMIARSLASKHGSSVFSFRQSEAGLLVTLESQ